MWNMALTYVYSLLNCDLKSIAKTYIFSVPLSKSVSALDACCLMMSIVTRPCAMHTSAKWLYFALWLRGSFHSSSSSIHSVYYTHITHVLLLVNPHPFVRFGRHWSFWCKNWRGARLYKFICLMRCVRVYISPAFCYQFCRISCIFMLIINAII